MILRRLVDNLKQQHWTGVLIELAIVVLGVFLGIQASNWNDDRATREKSAVFTARLKADLADEEWGARLLVEYNREVLANVGLTLHDLSGAQALSDEQFLVSAYRASQYAFLNRSRSTYDELVSTGDMGLITDQRLRQTATVVYSTPILDRIGSAGRSSDYRRLFRRSLAPEVQADLLARCGDRIETFQEPLAHLLDYPCTLQLPTSQITAAARALRANPDLVPALQLQFADLQTNLADLRNTPEIANDLRAYARRQP